MSAPRGATNLVVWLIVALVISVTGVARLWGIYPSLFGVAFAAAAVGAVLRGAAVAALGLFLEALLEEERGRALAGTTHRRLLRALWVGSLLFGTAFAADGVVDAFLGYHLSTAFRILFAGGVSGLGPTVEAVGASPRSVAQGVAVVAVVVGLLVVVFRLSRAASSRLGWQVPSSTARWAAVMLLAAVVGEELASPVLKPVDQWAQEREAQPLVVAPNRPDPSLVSLAVRVKVPPRPTVVAPAPRARPDVLLVIVESFRRDAVSPLTTPHLLGLTRTPGTVLLTAATTANVTHYSWYGLFTGQYPVSYLEVRRTGTGGSLPLSLLGAAGYRTTVLASADLAYQAMGATVFGPPPPWLHLVPEPKDPLVVDRDKKVVDDLLARLTEGPRGGRLFVLGLNASHFDYSFPDDFTPEWLTPEEAPPLAALTRRYQAEHLRTRYLRALAWVDTQLGVLFDGLAARGALEDTVVFVTGDHGEAFGEHGVFAHGTDLNREQIEVPLVVHLPPKLHPLGLPAASPLAHPEVPVSLVDVMPTVLAELGLDRAVPRGALAGQPLQLPGAEGPRVVVQGWDRDQTRFAVVHAGKKALFSLDHPQPALAKRLSLTQVTTRDDQPLEHPNVLEALERLDQVLPFVELP